MPYVFDMRIVHFCVSQTHPPIQQRNIAVRVQVNPDENSDKPSHETWERQRRRHPIPDIVERVESVVTRPTRGPDGDTKPRPFRIRCTCKRSNRG